MSIHKAFQKVIDGIYYLSTLDTVTATVSGTYVIMGEKTYIVETGTQEVASLLLNSLDDLGVSREGIAGVIATHIHLDHTGGAGWLVKQMPWLKVYVHERGAKHLIDPSRLLDSADKVYGGRERVIGIHGEILPVPEENVIPVEEAAVDAGDGFTLHIMPAPGHAPHHLLIFEETSGAAFVGELPGHYIPDDHLLYPAIAPPGFDYRETLNSLDRLEALAPSLLCFSQFGFTDSTAQTISLAREQLSRMRATLLRLHEEGVSVGEMVQELLQDPMYEFVSKLPQKEPLEDLFIAAVVGFIQDFSRGG
jgi:glyoxylase-like metal-dependent hydrolase (beta-lactamase superfamily II)